MNRQLRSTRLKGIVGLGVLAALLLLYVLGPRFAEPQHVRENAKTVDQIAANTNIQVAKLQERSKTIEAARQQMTNYNKRYPDTPALPELQVALTKAADASGLGSRNILSVVTQDPTNMKAAEASTDNKDTKKADASKSNDPEMWQMPVTIQVRSTSYSTLARFASALYTMDRAFVIDDLKITPFNGANGTVGGYSMNIVGRAFLLQAPDSKYAK